MAPLTPTTVGSPNSRATMAAWLSGPPSSTILQATADEIVEGGLGELSLQAVAARLTADQGAWVVVEGLDGLPAPAPEVWRSWERQGSIYEALERIDAAGSGPASEAIRADRRARTEQLILAVAERRPDLPAEEIEEIATFLHAVVGQSLWSRTRRLSDLTAERSGPVTTWVLALIVDALDRGDSPRQPGANARP